MTFIATHKIRFLALKRQFLPVEAAEIWKALAWALALGVAVYIALTISRTQTFVCAIWPANGIFLAGMLLAQSVKGRNWTAALCIISNVIFNLLAGEPLTASVGYTVANASEVILAYVLLRRANISFDTIAFDRLDVVARFVLICGFIAPAGASAIGAAVISATFDTAFLPAYQTWFLADSLGHLIVTPALVMLFNRPLGSAEAADVNSIVVHFAVLLAVCALVFLQTSAPLLFLVMPVSVLIAFRFGPRYAAFATVLVSVIAVGATIANLGPVALIAAGPSFKAAVVQIFCFANLLTTLTVAAEVATRQSLSRQLGLASREAAENSRQLQAALESMSQGVCLFDADERIVMRNDRFLNLYGLPADRVCVGMSFRELIGLCAEFGIAPEQSSGALSMACVGDADQKLSNGSHFRLSQRRLADGGMICSYTDITLEKQAEAALKHRTLHDVLTGLPNRRLLMDRLDSALTEIGDRQAAVMLLDVDHFKSINDTFGHGAGDHVLVTVGQRLRSCVRDDDTVARLGGDEFAVLLATIDAERSAHMVAHRILDAMREPVAYDGKSLTIGLSVGFAIIPRDATTGGSALKAADSALYAAKRNGRNTFAAFDNPVECDASHELAA